VPRRLPAVPNHEVLEKLGQGGMGVVYKARQVQLNRVVALKMIRADSLANQEAADRFRVEAEAVARLQHPNIIQIYEIGEVDGLPYFSLEYCPGGSLADSLDGTPLPAREAARLLEPLVRAVAAAHRQQVIHRDLKPANVLLAADGSPRVSDFGLAKLLDGDAAQTQSGQVLGTPSYMAPEQAAGKLQHIGPATDVYALGAILYELLTGRAPFRAATVLDTLAQVVADEPVPPRLLNRAVDRDLETVCLKCLEKEPQRRYATAEELADDLGRYLSEQPIRARSVGALDRLARGAGPPAPRGGLPALYLAVPPLRGLVVRVPRPDTGAGERGAGGRLVLRPVPGPATPHDGGVRRVPVDAAPAHEPGRPATVGELGWVCRR